MAEGSSGRRRFSDKWGKHELDVLAVLSSAFPQWLTSRQIAQRVKAYADSYGELADQAAKAAFAKQFQRDRAKLAGMGIAIESRQPEYSSKSEGQDFASYRLQLGDEPRVRLMFAQDDLPVLATANYLARSMSMSSKSQHPNQQTSRTAPRVPQTPVPGLGLDSIAPGLGTQPIPDDLVKAIDSRRFAATIDVDGEHINVAYADSDDLATYVLEHPGATIISPQEAVDAYHRRLNAALEFEKLPKNKKAPIASNPSADSDIDEEALLSGKKTTSFQTGSEVDRRLRLMLFLSAHLGEEFELEELTRRFVGIPKSEDELKKFMNILHKDINTLTTVSDDGEMAGSQFFDIDWSLLETEGIVSATNSLGLERLAGISQQYLSMLTASVSYLAHSPLLPADQRDKAEDLYERLQQHVKPGETPWLSLTGYETEPASMSVVRRAVSTHALLNMEYTDAAGRIRRRIVAPVKTYVDEGVYYVVAWTEVGDYVPEEYKEILDNEHLDGQHTWQVLRIARIEKAKLVKPTAQMDVPEVPMSELRKWSVENGTQVMFTTDKHDLPFVQALESAKVDSFGDGDKVKLTVVSDSWFVAFCIAHARDITAVYPETLRSMIQARAKRELSLSSAEETEE